MDGLRALTTRISRLGPAVPVLLRVTVGVVMAYHGYQKLTGGPAGFGNGMVAGLGVPAPVLIGWLVTLAELVGGIMLIVGVATRLAALAILPILIGATLLVKRDLGLIAPGGSPLPGSELDLLLIASLVSIVILGPGPLSVDDAIGIEDTGLASGSRGEPVAARG
jgi:putative oxidoreductase